MTGFKNLKISYKFLLGFLLVIILVGSASLYMGFTNRQINQEVIQHAQIIEAAQKLIQSTENSYSLMSKYLLVENTAELELLKPKIADSLFQTYAVIKTFKGREVNDYTLNIIETYLQNAAAASQDLTYSHDLKLGLELSKQTSKEKIEDLKADERKNLNIIQDTQSKTEQSIAEIVKFSQEDFQKTQALAKQSQNIALAILIGGVVFAIIISFLLARIILKPVYQLTEVASKVAKGDLTERVNIQSGDEIGYLSRIFDNMLDNIENSQKQIKAGEEQLKNANSELKDQLAELQNFKEVTVGRELKMVELKEEIQKLKKK